MMFTSDDVITENKLEIVNICVTIELKDAMLCRKDTLRDSTVNLFFNF